MSYKDFEPVIGVEVHVELKTASKVFCTCSAVFGQAPNTACCPICMGLPGALPSLNGQAVRYAIMAGMALHCSIREKSWFDRKNYFYPDLPKGYQITQYDTPFCTDGYVEIPGAKKGEAKRIRINRIHLEEDAGKLVHQGEYTYVDYNRCGVGLIEIVSEPDMRDPEEVKAYLTELRRLLLYTGVSDCRMNEGSMRCDVNISVRRKESEAWGTRCEIKNLNSIGYAGKAIEEEWKRQSQILEAGGTVEQETRRFNEDTGHTETMRKKENAVDYRYFPEPNIPPVILPKAYLAEVERQMPKMPDAWKREFMEKYGLTEADCERVTMLPATASYYCTAAEQTRYPKLAANLYIGELLPGADEEGNVSLAAAFLAETADLFGDGKIGSTTAKKLLILTAEEGLSPTEIADRDGLYQITEEALLLPYVHEAIAANAKALADWKKGKKAAEKIFLGAVIRATDGRAAPAVTEKVISAVLTDLGQ